MAVDRIVPCGRDRHGGQAEMAARLMVLCLWLVLVIRRTSVTYGVDKDISTDSENLLFAPEKLLPASRDADFIIQLWHEIPYLHVRPSYFRRYVLIPTHYWLLLLYIAGGVELTPGPVKFPCTLCYMYKPMTARQRGVQCSRCDKWMHAKCHVHVSMVDRT